MKTNALTGGTDASYQKQMFDPDASGDNPKPTRKPLAEREASPARYATSGMEQAMGEQADKLHKRRR